MKLQFFLMAVVLTIAATVSGQVYAKDSTFKVAESSIICHTPRAQLALKISPDHISFIERNRGVNHRSIASTKINAVRTQFIGNGYRKTLHFENKRHTISIKDFNDLNEIDNYIVIKNNEGHEITYPLNCEHL